jgi:hypothetical protein
MADDSREENVYMAKLAEQAERYDEVCVWLCTRFRRHRRLRCACVSHEHLI